MIAPPRPRTPQPSQSSSPATRGEPVIRRHAAVAPIGAATAAALVA